ncbi:Methyltransferase-like protein 22 [Linnemannia gamsii]|uniref:Methyltransferase-like protein 22 n=1 Tax=Linnemannia gamsii TaxID=64522 RepID=A0ABQ7JN40_9FUNG|nr:Methyltransferase-like protein 22 [Linnemannia gamsii]
MTTTTTTNEDDDTVLSEVHIHPDNGLVDRRTITSTFLLSRKGQPVVDSQQNNCLDNNNSKCSDIKAQGDDVDNDEDEHEEEGEEVEEEPEHWDYAVEIKHAMGTDLRCVGSQVWMGCFLLIDWIVHIQEQLNGTIVLEIGAGTGLASIATNLLIAVDRVFCTDYDSDILQNCKINIDLNGVASDIVKTRRLNWLMDDPLEAIEENQTPDPFGWSSQESEDWKENGAFILAADVVYDDSLTDALISCLEKLLSEPLPVSHPRHFIGRVAYMTMEKRYNFSLDQLAVAAQAYEYFKLKIERSLLIEAEEIDVATLTRHCDYDRTKDLVLFRIGCKD